MNLYQLQSELVELGTVTAGSWYLRTSRRRKQNNAIQKPQQLSKTVLSASTIPTIMEHGTINGSRSSYVQTAILCPTKLMCEKNLQRNSTLSIPERMWRYCIRSKISRLKELVLFPNQRVNHSMVTKKILRIIQFNSVGKFSNLPSLSLWFLCLFQIKQVRNFSLPH